MNTKTLMIASSIVPGIAGAFALFAPHEILAGFGLPQTDPLPIIIQLLGALYLGFAYTNWTAKDSVIGGVYARSISLGNFTHFTVGALVLAKAQFSAGASVLLWPALVIYAIFAMIFGWLIFVYSGIAASKDDA